MTAKPSMLVYASDNSVREALEYAASELKVPIRYAGSGNELLNKAIKSEPKLIVMEPFLLDMSAISLIKTLRKKCNTPIIMISDPKYSIIESSFYCIGVNDFICTPLKKDALLYKLRNNYFFSNACKLFYIYKTLLSTLIQAGSQGLAWKYIFLRLNLIYCHYLF